MHLGRSGLSVSRLCLGTMNFGPLTPPAEALFPGYRPAPEHYAW